MSYITKTAMEFYADLGLGSSAEQSLTNTNMFTSSHSEKYEKDAELQKADRAYRELGIYAEIDMDDEEVNRKLDEEAELPFKQPRNPKAKPVYFKEDIKTDTTKLDAKGVRNIDVMAQIRGITRDKMLNKALWYKNTSTNIIIFIVTQYKADTWKKIYSAVMNNKTVVVNCTEGTYTLERNSSAFAFISGIFDEKIKAENERKRQFARKMSRQNKVAKFKFVEITLPRAITLEVLKDLYEIEGEPVECYNMIAEYLRCQLAPTRVLTPNSAVMSQLQLIPMHILEWLVPTLIIDFNAVDSETAYFGNEDMLDALDFEESEW